MERINITQTRVERISLLRSLLGGGPRGTYYVVSQYNLTPDMRRDIITGLEGIEGISVQSPNVGDGRISGFRVRVRESPVTYNVLTDKLPKLPGDVVELLYPSYRMLSQKYRQDS